jgi:hypothetical protein
MPWSVSAVFGATIDDSLDNTTPLDLNSDTFRLALFNTTPTPDKNVTSANTAYGVGQWATGGVSDTNWPAVGIALTGVTTAFSAGVWTFDANDTPSSGTVTLSAVNGHLCYDDTLTTPVADQGVCFNYYGGSQSVTAGTFTVVHDALGIMRATY